MKRTAWLTVGALALVALGYLSLGPIAAMADAEVPAKAEHGYLGAQECKVCHSSDAKGAQFKKWEASAHAQAYQALLTDASKKIAAGLGIKEPPEKADQCLKCHVTGHGVQVELLGKKYAAEQGVGCESCHGPAADWKTLHMKDVEAAKAAGMSVPDEKTCKTCHNEESPTYKEFKFAEALAVIAHPNPKQADK